MPNHSFQRARTLVLILGAAAWLQACSAPKSSSAAPADAPPDAAAPADAAGDAPPPPGSDAALLLVSHTPSAISIDNKIGRRLINIRIELRVAESDQPYILVVPTIEKDTKEDFQLMTFRTDAAEMLIDPSAVHPKEVNIKAHDSFGRAHEITVPWASE
jgi:hypothetical protein